MNLQEILETEIEESHYPYEYNVYRDESTRATISQIWVRLDGTKYGDEGIIEDDDATSEMLVKVRYQTALLDMEIMFDQREEIMEGEEFPRSHYE